MGGGVGGVDKLAGNKAAGNLPGQFLSPGDGSGHARGPRGQNQLRAVGPQQLPPLRAHGFRHDDDGPVPPGRRHGSQADAGIAGGGLDDDRAGAQQAPGLRIVQHGLGHPVLYAAGRIEILQLRQNAGLQALLPLYALQLQQRGSADQLIGGRIDAAHMKRLLCPGCPAGGFHGIRP